MQLSKNRILVTHVGSLPRPPVLDDLLIRQEAGETVDEALLEREAAEAVRNVVARQIEAGIDIVNDGEQPRVGFQTYIVRRMSGFGGESKRPRAKDMQEFRIYARQLAQCLSRRPKVANARKPSPHYGTSRRGRGADEKAALKAQKTPPLDMTHCPASSLRRLNAHYDSHEAYVMALARIEARVSFVVDHPADRRARPGDGATAVPGRRWRSSSPSSSCISRRPALGDILQRSAAALLLGQLRPAHPRRAARRHPALLYRANAGALSLEFANPRHAHEYPAFRQHPLPTHMA